MRFDDADPVYKWTCEDGEPCEWVPVPNSYNETRKVVSFECIRCHEVRTETLEEIRRKQKPLDDHFGEQWEKETGRKRRKVGEVVSGVRIIDVD